MLGVDEALVGAEKHLKADPHRHHNHVVQDKEKHHDVPFHFCIQSAPQHTPCVSADRGVLTGEACADDFGNRVLAVTNDNMVLIGDSATNAAPCFNSCGTCLSPTQVTFRVDMTTQETDCL